ncbi:MAG: hypothetical protein IRY86_08875 [Thermorudis peleae]|nr:hypothetical protein [Thermorudis peleae]
MMLRLPPRRPARHERVEGALLSWGILYAVSIYWTIICVFLAFYALPWRQGPDWFVWLNRFAVIVIPFRLTMLGRLSLLGGVTVADVASLLASGILAWLLLAILAGWRSEALWFQRSAVRRSPPRQ